MTARIVAAWALVGIPLAYGLVETLRKAADLFTG
ncbi:MFS transporter small subunit [Nocardioides sp. CPCC 206349]